MGNDRSRTLPIWAVIGIGLCSITIGICLLVIEERAGWEFIMAAIVFWMIAGIMKALQRIDKN